MAIELRALTRADLPSVRDFLARGCDLPDAALVAEEKLFGAAPGHLKTESFGAFSEQEPLGVAAASGKWLRMLAVRPDARGRGIGTSLLAMAESAIASTGAAAARTLDQPGNYLAPGIEAGDAETLTWFAHRGYREAGRNTNLLIDLADNPTVSPAALAQRTAHAAAAGYAVARADRDRAAVIAGAIGATFGPVWAFEVERAMAADPAGVHVAVHRASGDVAGFAAHDGNNRGLGWFGPAGTFEGHRRRGLGAALLVACLLDVARAGKRTGIISWIGPRDFYARAVGVAGERRYVVLEKDLRPILREEPA